MVVERLSMHNEIENMWIGLLDMSLSNHVDQGKCIQLQKELDETQQYDIEQY